MDSERPEYVTDKHLRYLKDLRDSGVTNMFGAAPYLQEEFPALSRHQATQILIYWMETFQEE